jgi:hypothetical protein
MEEWVWCTGGMILTGENEVLGEKHYTASVVDGRMNMAHWWDDTDRGKRKYWEKTCHNATLCTTWGVAWDQTLVLAVTRCCLAAWGLVRSKHSGNYVYHLLLTLTLWICKLCVIYRAQIIPVISQSSKTVVMRVLHFVVPLFVRCLSHCQPTIWTLYMCSVCTS